LTRLSAIRAKSILAEELAKVGWEATSAFTVQQGARPETADLDWWHENTPANESSDTKRNLAYLRAYMRIGGDRLYAGGLFLARKRLWMDRSVVSRLERDGYLRFCGAEKSEPWFELTDQGRSWLSQVSE
jgi:hypothetical protein